MSIPNINITTSNIAGNCDLKCSYNFKYSESNSTAKNNGVTIGLTYDSTNVANVIFNNQKYNVGNITIASPSIHIFNGATMPGEMIITHNPVVTGNILEVCIPFTSSSDSSSASQLITEIIDKVATNAPSEGETTNLNISNFTLQTIVPRSPYFYYNNNNTDWIVFGSLDAIPLSSSTISTLQQIIQPYPLATPGEDLFYNSKGPITGLQLGDGIYISCNPTGSFGEDTAVTYDKSPTTAVDFSNIFQSSTFKLLIQILVGVILFIIIFYMISLFYGYITSDAPKLPNLPKLPSLLKFTKDK
jgi:carbonic anhydrase